MGFLETAKQLDQITLPLRRDYNLGKRAARIIISSMQVDFTVQDVRSTIRSTGLPIGLPGLLAAGKVVREMLDDKSLVQAGYTIATGILGIPAPMQTYQKPAHVSAT